MWGKFKLILLDNNVESCRSISRAFYGKYAIIKNDTRIRYHFPAQAGMILISIRLLWNITSIPRASGDDPTFLGCICFSGEYSPHKRGFFIVSDRQNDLILLYSKQEIKLRKYC